MIFYQFFFPQFSFFVWPLWCEAWQKHNRRQRLKRRQKHCKARARNWMIRRRALNSCAPHARSPQYATTVCDTYCHLKRARGILSVACRHADMIFEAHLICAVIRRAQLHSVDVVWWRLHKVRANERERLFSAIARRAWFDSWFCLSFESVRHLSDGLERHEILGFSVNHRSSFSYCGSFTCLFTFARKCHQSQYHRKANAENVTKHQQSAEKCWFQQCHRGWSWWPSIERA